MLREKIDKARGWWRKLNRPLVSELPRPVIWMSLVYNLFFVALITIAIIYTQTLSHPTMFDVGSRDSMLISCAILIAILLYSVLLDAVLLFLPKTKIAQNRFILWHKDAELKTFTNGQLIVEILATIFIGFMCFAFVSTMQWQQERAQKDLILLEEMHGGNLSLDDEWLKLHDVSMQQYAQTRQNVINDGWEHVHIIAIDSRQEAIYILVLAISAFCMMVFRVLAGVYFTWRYYPRGNRA